MISDGDDLTLREKTALRSLWRLSSSGHKHRLHSGRLRSTGPMEHGQVQHTSTLQYFKVQTADSREQTAYSLQPTAYLSLMYRSNTTHHLMEFSKVIGSCRVSAK